MTYFPPRCNQNFINKQLEGILIINFCCQLLMNVFSCVLGLKHRLFVTITCFTMGFKRLVGKAIKRKQSTTCFDVADAVLPNSFARSVVFSFDVAMQNLRIVLSYVSAEGTPFERYHQIKKSSTTITKSICINFNT